MDSKRYSIKCADYTDFYVIEIEDTGSSLIRTPRDNIKCAHCRGVYVIEIRNTGIAL